MPLFRATLRKACDAPNIPREGWSNIYYIQAADLAAAANEAEQLWHDYERTFHSIYAYCYEAYVSDLVPNTSVYTTVGIAPGFQRGVRNGGGEVMALWNAVRVDLTTPSGRPSRKFYHLPLSEGDVAGMRLSTEVVAAIVDAFTDVFAEVPLRDESGQVFTGFILKGLTSKRLGRHAGSGVPAPPPSA
jgi:hypothetical protein